MATAAAASGARAAMASVEAMQSAKSREAAAADTRIVRQTLDVLHAVSARREAQSAAHVRFARALAQAVST